MYRKNITGQYIYFALINSTNGVALTGATVTAYRSLDNAAQAAATGTTTELGNGQYRFNLSQADTNCNNGSFLFTATNAVPVEKTVVFTSVNPTDATAFGIGNLDAAISSRSSQASVDSLTTYVDTEVAAIKAKTDNLPIDPADASDIAASFSTVNSTLATISGYIDTEVAAIKAKTDNLPAQPAAVGSAMTLTVAYDAAKTAASQTSVDTLATYVDTEVAAIKAKTDNLPVDPADASDIAAAFATVNSTLATIAGYIDTEVAAIKAKTDNLPIDPADASDIAASFASLTSLVNTLTSYVDTEVAAIKAKTDNLPAQPAAVGDAMTLTVAYDAAKTAASQTSVNTLTTYVDTEVAAIKAKTDNLPASPAAVSDIPTANQNRDALLNALPSAGYVNGSFGDRWLISASPQRTVAVTGSNHIAADVHEFQPAVITAGDFAAGAIDANALAADAASEIAVRVADEPLAGHTTAGTLGKVLSDAGSGITTLLGRITSTVYTMFTDLVQMIVNDGTASAQWSSTAMQNIPVAGGTGARSVTITVRDSSSNPIQNASVRVYRTGESFILSTNASGVAAFSLDDATWTVAITATGFSFTPATLVVGGNVSQAYTMTTAGGGVTPSEPPFCTGFWTVYNQNGTIQAGAQVSIQASSPPVGSTGIVMEDAVRTATADNSGVVQFSNLIKGATYIVYRTGSSRKFTITVPTNAGNTQALGSIVG